ncbi:ABC transporter ATP-binding protein/permease [Micromonospora sp. NBC_01699]|uniref:ABC transporter ATP-binding protein n=1 Tax=Micromonospora sp. NBC_01699 TaxID=2975984 RepID=UPI002E2A9639|nr:ABC transporter ATP-binding protein [Micromonospora sp. NBC_01699]
MTKGPDVRWRTVRRILPYVVKYRGMLSLLLLLTVLEAAIVAAGPLILKAIVDNGILPGRTSVVGWLCLAVVGLALLDAAITYGGGWLSGRVGEGLVYDLRTQVFTHVQQQSVAFFTRAETGALMSRLNTDVIGARQAVTTLLSNAAGTTLTLVFVVGTMIYLSWQLALISLVLIPIFLPPVQLLARRVQRLTRQTMQLDAELSSMMSERFNVSGAILAKLFGRPEEESRLFAARAARLRDVVARTVVQSRMMGILVSVVTALITAVVYGVGGVLTIEGTVQIGTLVAMAALLARLYGPVNEISEIHVAALTTALSFERLFELLDLEPQVRERPGARVLPVPPDGSAPDVRFEEVNFRYPTAADLPLGSLESITIPEPDRPVDRWTLQDLSFHAPAGKLTALVGPSGAGKSTITHLVQRLYDPQAGTVRLGGHDLRDLTLQSVRDAICTVTQDAHLFHDTLRANLLYARSEATEQELIDACVAAQIWDAVQALPNGLDTVVGERGYRFSGGERQRLALARLLVKSASVVVLDEATAHLDSESELSIQRALSNALAGRTSLVIAHRLSTIREADQILVIDQGRVREQGTHDELLLAGGLYAELYRTQFAEQAGDVPAIAS